MHDKVTIRLVENGFIVEYQSNTYKLVERFEGELKDVFVFLEDYWKYQIEEKHN